MISRRLLAGVAAGLAAAGGVLFIGAVLADQGVWYAGFVSEVGVPGRPFRTAYRLGLIGVGVGVVLLAGMLRPLAGVPALALALGGLLAGASAVVPCSPGCPLPPYETPTAQDLVHAGASVAGAGLCALGVLLLALRPTGGALRRVARVAIGPVVLLGLATVYGLAFLGRSVFTGTVERLLLALLIAWSVAAAVVVGRAREP
ncbi:DUF998 domain-containing protein [Luedemannella helvata]|uniref:DUF998 domain-containing protein n=1 Tax=Luedemannella helvata TaxID=349315 RepID=A0ABP4VYQ7_9ACTN